MASNRANLAIKNGMASFVHLFLSVQREQTGSSSSILDPSDIYKTWNPNISFLTLCPQQQLAKPLSFVHAAVFCPDQK